jgi:K+-transporting ATPase ATPase A chain
MAAIELVLFLVFLLVLSPLLGKYIANVFLGDTPWLLPYLGWIERGCYKFAGIDDREEMNWKEYGKALLAFNLFGIAFLFLLQIFQGYLPLNPEHFSGVAPAQAFNTAVSFVTNTNWQPYAGETTLSYLTQMVGLTSQNFLSAATGIAALLVLIRGISHNAVTTVGNFWRDLTRSVVYLLLPLSLILALFLVSQGVVQTFSPYIKVTTLEKEAQVIPLGPVASQVAIKQLGSNGGGYFNTNSAHPFENPTPLSNFFEMLVILLIPAALVFTYGRLVGSRKEGRVIFWVMFFLFSTSLASVFLAEHFFPSEWEGKETRLGMMSSLLWTISTTATSNGSVNAMLTSLSPLTGGIALFNIKLGEIIFGGVGVGLCSMLMFVFLTVFLSGLMVGRSPEYLGKKIEKREMQWVMLAILLPGLLTLLGSSFAATMKDGIDSIGNKGPHGLTEILYTFSSTTFNNGSAFTSFDASTPAWNWILGIFMLLGRASIILSSLAIGGSLAKKRIAPVSKGTLSTSSFIFAFMLVGTILIVGGLTFFPSLAVGSILENFLMLNGKVF